MYAFVDRPVTSLDHGCRFLIWSLRSWALVARQRRCPGPPLAPAFAKWRMVGALQPFLRLMIVFERDVLQPLRFCSLTCPRIAEHEALVLSLFVTMAKGERVTLRDTLALMLNEDALGDALAAIDRVSLAMSAAGLVPTIPDTAVPKQ